MKIKFVLLALSTVLYTINAGAQCTLPTSPTSNHTATCNSNPIMVTAYQPMVTGLTHKWYTSASGTTTIAHQILNTSGTYITGVLQSYSASTTYYVAAVNGCGESPRTPVTVSVSPPTLTASGNVAKFCAGNTGDILSTDLGYTYSWTKDGTTISGATSSSYHPTASGAYRVIVSKSGCPTTTLGPLNVTVVSTEATPSAPTGSNINVCAGSTQMINAQSPFGVTGVTHKWYTSAGGSTIEPSQVLNNSPYVTGVLKSYTTNTSYFVSAVNSCGESARTPLTVTVLSSPSGAPTVTGNKAFSGDAITLVGNGTPSGGTYKWYSPAGALLKTGLNYAVPGILNSSVPNYMYVKAVSAAGCESAQAWINIDIFPLPVITATSLYSIKQDPVTLSVQPIYDTYEWRNSSNTIVSTLPGFDVLFPGTYTVKVTKSGLSKIAGIIIKGQREDLNFNYIIASTALKKGVTPVNYPTLPVESVKQEIQYVDGLSRPMESVVTQGSPQKQDIVQPIVYDQYGRSVRSYLPFTAEKNGRYKTVTYDATGNYTGIAANFYANNPQSAIAQDQRPFSETVYEASPLNRPLKDYGPGKNWKDNNKFIEHGYSTNIDGTQGESEKIIAWKIDASGMPVRNTVVTGALSGAGYYPSGTLYVKSTIDEQNNEVREYSDKLGRVVLKKVYVTGLATDLANRNNWAQTYYVYDAMGNLRYVFQPELSKTIHQNDTYNPSTTDLNAFAFQYKYDARRRMSEKKVPGAGWVYMVYDNRDRLVLTQDGQQRSQATKYWTFTKYDELNRPILTGIKDTSAVLTQQQMQAAVNNHYSKPWTKYGETYIGAIAGNLHGYSNKSYPVFTSGTTANVNHYLTVTYYDKYDFKSLSAPNYEYKNENLSEVVNGVTYAQPLTPFNNVIGQITGTKVKVLDSRETWLRSVNYYDDKYRLIQNISDNYMGGHYRVTNVFDFTGKILKSKTTALEWKDFLHLSSSGSRLVCTAYTAGWGHSGAVSQQQLAAGTDGWMEVVMSETNTARMIGLSKANINASYNTIDYALYPYSDGKLYIYENGTRVTSTYFTSYGTGDVFRIERTGSVIKYYKGTTLLHASAIPSTTALMIDAAMHTTNGTTGHIEASFATTVTRRFLYDHAGRILQTWHKLNLEPEILLVNNEYNELGQLIDKKLHSVQANASDARQSIDYRYNIRGWLTSINNSSLSQESSTNDDTRDFFGMDLGYNTDIGIGNSLFFNGNISGIKWSNNLGLSAVKEKSYSYSYDPMNRITGAAFKEKNTTWNMASNNGFSVLDYGYDLNGNITQLTRYDKRGSSAPMDNLIYDYGTGNTRGNQLFKVSEKTGTDAGDKTAGFKDGANAGNDYTYDLNGNMNSDLNKNIAAISYNHLNLPMNVIISNRGRVGYIYDALGNKLKQEVISDTVIRKESYYNGESFYEGEVKRNSVLYNWHFNSNTMGWTKNSRISSFTWNAAGYVVGVVSAGDPFISSGVVSVPIDKNVVIKIRMKVSTAKQYSAQMFFTTTTQTGVNEIKSLRFPLIPVNDQFNEYIVDMSLNPYWTGTLRTLRLDPTNYLVAGETFAVDYIQVIRTDGVKSPSLQFLQHEEGRVVMTGTTPEYQYHLKDHLGNVRVTFTSKIDTESAVATMEDANASSEAGNFLYYTEAVKVNTTLFDHTNAGTTYYSTRLNGSEDERTGLARSISVMPGDTVKTEVYAKYLDPNSSNWTTALNNLITSIANGTAPPGTFVDGGAPGSTGGVPFPYGSLLNKGSETGAAPKAYLNYLIFDRDYNLVNGGFVRMTTAAREYGQDGPHEKLAAQFVITDPGYVYIYLSNDNAALGGSQIETYWDDFKVEQVKSPVIQAQDYYPFGLTFNSYSRENSVPNMYKFTGKEVQDELDLRWLDYGARMYEPSIGRWVVIDPLSENSISMTPYQFVANNPVIFVDPNGEDWFYYKAEGQEEADWHYQKGSSYNTGVKDENGKEVVLTGVENIVKYTISGINDRGAAVGTIDIYEQDQKVLSQINVMSGSYHFKDTQPADAGTYWMNLEKANRDEDGPNEFSGIYADPAPDYGAQKIPGTGRGVWKKPDGTLKNILNSHVQDEYGYGRIRLNPSKEVIAANTRRYGKDRADRGLYLHGKRNEKNWTHGCVCDKTEKVFDYLWNNFYSRTPFVIYHKLKN